MKVEPVLQVLLTKIVEQSRNELSFELEKNELKAKKLKTTKNSLFFFTKKIIKIGRVFKKKEH